MLLVIRKERQHERDMEKRIVEEREIISVVYTLKNFSTIK
jgi:hypothetical protein